MSAIKNVLFGLMLVLAMLPSVASAADLQEAQLVVTPNEEGNALNISLFLFTSEATPSDRMTGEQILKCCMDEPGYDAYCNLAASTGFNQCLIAASAQQMEGANYEPAMQTVQNANFTVLYYSPSAQRFIGVPGCSPVLSADQQAPADPSAAGSLDMWYATCEIPDEVYTSESSLERTRRVNIKVLLTEMNGGLMADDYPITLSSTSATGESEIIATIKEIMNSITTGRSPMCLGAFMIMGLLLASMYFAGRSPISLLDITTPKLPAPKGIAASGQILTPFGYGEMKATLRNSLDRAGGAAAATIAAKGVAGRNSAQAREIESLSRSAPATSGDIGVGDTDKQRAMGRTAALAALDAGMGMESARTLARTLPYHYGDAEHRTVSELIERLNARGGRDALLAGTLKQYIAGTRQLQSLETLMGHPDIGVRGPIHSRVEKYVGKAFSANRFALVGPALGASIGSVSRTMKIGGRGAKSIVNQGAAFTREVARTSTMAVMGGEAEYEARRAAARKKGGTAAAAYAWMEKPPSRIEVGGMYQVHDKMQYFGNALVKEVHDHGTAFVMGEMYRQKAGIKMAITEKELAEMGHRDMDVVAMCGVRRTPALTAMEEEMRSVLTRPGLSAQQRMEAMTELAERMGVHLDPNMKTFYTKVHAVEEANMPEYAKALALQQVLEEQHRAAPAAAAGEVRADGKFYTVVGRDSLQGSDLFGTLVFRTMVHDGERNMLTEKAGIEDSLKAAWLNTVNRMVTLDPTSAMNELPEYMRNKTELGKVRDRARAYFMEMFTEEGAKGFQQVKGKGLSQATIREMVEYCEGGAIPRTGQMMKGGEMAWWQGAEFEKPPPAGAFKMDMKRHWLPKLDERDNLALAQWTESRFTRAHIRPDNAALEAEMKRMPGSGAWSDTMKNDTLKRLWVEDLVKKDTLQRFNSTFCNNAYGTMHELSHFYNGTLAAFMERALRKNEYPENHGDLRFLQSMDMQNPKDLGRFRKLTVEHEADLRKVLSEKLTYDDVARSKNVWVMMGEGGFVSYRKNMKLSNHDRIFNGTVALRDKEGHLTPFIADDVKVQFGGRRDLEMEWARLQEHRNPAEWKPFMENVAKWANESTDTERQKVAGAVSWRFGNQTNDFGQFWQNNQVHVAPKREVTPVSPMLFRMFEAEAPSLMKAIKPFRDIAMHLGDYASRVALDAGGAVHRASWDITPISEYYRQLSTRNAARVLSTDFSKLGMSKEEEAAYRALALSHGKYDQVWAFAIDRNPWVRGRGFGSHQAWESFFTCGPARVYSTKDNLRAYMSRGQYLNFMAQGGLAIEFARKMINPYVGMARTTQQEIQGYASKWDQTQNPLMQWNYSQPRLLAAFRAMNPFSSTFGQGRIAKLLYGANKWESAPEHAQLAGNAHALGLSVGPQDVWLQQSGVYTVARVGTVNPGASLYRYNMDNYLDPVMADYLIRRGESAFVHDKSMREMAMNTIQRRTVDAEALMIRRTAELSNFGMSQNSLFRFFSAPMAVWHGGLRQLMSWSKRRYEHGGRSVWESGADAIDRGASAIGRAMTPWAAGQHRACACGRYGRTGSTCAKCGNLV